MNKHIKYISDFKNYKKFYQLTKPRSPIIIEFMSDDEDEWLIDIIKYKRKKGEVSDNFIILQKEIQYWLERYSEEGWVLTHN